MALAARIGLALLLIAAVFVLPDADVPSVAARQAHELLELPLPADAPGARGPDGEVLPEEDRPTLGQWVLAGPHAYERTADSVKLGLAGVRFAGVDVASPVHLSLRRSVVQGMRQVAAADGLSMLVPGELMPVTRGAAFLAGIYEDGSQFLRYEPLDGPAVTVTRGYVPPDRTSLLPPVVAVALAILLRRPLLALFAGVLAGAIVFRLRSGHEPLASAGGGLLDVFLRYFWRELVDWTGRGQIIAFVVLMLAMVGVVTLNGGIRGLMDRISRLAGDARRTQIAAYFMGLAVFFDDYANTILVGSTMRPLCDRFRIAREKLAYIVDSTAAPVAGISIFSTWIAFEVSTFSAQLPAAGLLATDGYSVFLQTLPYRFYCIFTLLFVGLVTFSGRDFGPMLRAERRARRTGEVVRKGGQPMVSDRATHLEPAAGVVTKARNAVLPVLVFVGVTLLEIVRGGGGFDLPAGQLLTLEGMSQVLNAGSGSGPLMIGSAAGLLVAVALSLAAGLRGEIARSAWNTLRSMGVAIGILYLAWMIGSVCQKELGTGPYLAELVSDRLEPKEALPLLLFALSGAIAFATGSSWSTMSILLPLVVGVSYDLGQSTALGGAGMMVLCIGSVLEGAIFGDHCSPISDTTVMSSIASASDHIDHVQTQAPYAFLCMVVAGVAGYFPCAFVAGYRPWYGWIAGAALLALLLRLRGKRADREPAAAEGGAAGAR